MDLSVVVVTYQSRNHILECLRSLEGAVRPDDGPAPAWECVVVDNDSRDGGPELVEREAAWARVVRTGGNLGYAKAVNRGIAATTGRHVLVSNPDCVWEAGSVAHLAAWLAYGIWVLLFAKLLGGNGGVDRFLGVTALYAIPNILGIFNPIPCTGTCPAPRGL